jgi:hypothetical protein
MALAFSILILHIPIFLIMSTLIGQNFRGSKDALTSPEDSGILRSLKQRKQYLKELQEGTFGSTK